MIRIKAIGRGFQCPGYKFGESWQSYRLDDGLRDLLLRHAGLHVRVHPEDMPMLLAGGISVETGAATKVAISPAVVVETVDAAIAAVDKAIELSAKAIVPRHEDRARGKARKF